MVSVRADELLVIASQVWRQDADLDARERRAAVVELDGGDVCAILLEVEPRLCGDWFPVPQATIRSSYGGRAVDVQLEPSGGGDAEEAAEEIRARIKRLAGPQQPGPDDTQPVAL